MTHALRTGRSIALVVLALLSFACSKKEEKPVGPAVATPGPKIMIPADSLQGLSLNGQAPDHLARQTGDPAQLEASDLAQFFQLFELDYFEKVLQLAQTQIATGKPLKGITLLFGSVPKRYAASCVKETSPDTCLAEPVAFDCNEVLPPKNWTEENHAKICQSLGRIKLLNPKMLVAAFDGDNTIWYQDVSNAGIKRGVESGKILWGEGKAELMSVYPPLEARKDYKTKATPYQYYEELYEKAGAPFNYEMAALAFRGLTLNEAYGIFKEAIEQPYKPIPFPEMVDLLRALQQMGVLTAVVSASPNFSVFPLVESLQTGIPLENIEGLDVYLRNPAEPGSLPVRLSRLLVQGKANDAAGLTERFKSYQEFLAAYGTWVIVDVDHILNARAGKAIAVRSMARRLAAKNNMNPGENTKQMDVDDMRMILIGGDNFAPFTDIPNPKGDRIQAALEAGNDQGLSEGLDFLEKSGGFGGTDILYIRRYSLESDKKAYPKKGGLDKFQAYADQEKLVRPTRVGGLIVQGAVTDVKVADGSGGFLKETPATTESQPMPESAPTPTASPKPQATPAPVPTPKPAPSPEPVAPLPPVASPAPSRPFGPLPAAPDAPPLPAPAAPGPVPAAPATPPTPAAPAAPEAPKTPPMKLEPLPPGPQSDAL